MRQCVVDWCWVGTLRGYGIPLHFGIGWYRMLVQSPRHSSVPKCAVLLLFSVQNYFPRVSSQRSLSIHDRRRANSHDGVMDTIEEASDAEEGERSPSRASNAIRTSPSRQGSVANLPGLGPRQSSMSTGLGVDKTGPNVSPVATGTAEHQPTARQSSQIV